MKGFLYQSTATSRQAVLLRLVRVPPRDGVCFNPGILNIAQCRVIRRTPGLAVFDLNSSHGAGIGAKGPGDGAIRADDLIFILFQQAVNVLHHSRGRVFPLRLFPCVCT